MHAPGKRVFQGAFRSFSFPFALECYFISLYSPLRVVLPPLDNIPTLQYPLPVNIAIE